MLVSLSRDYLKELASWLERYRGYWRMAVDYLCACLTHQILTLIDMQGRVPLETPLIKTIGNFCMCAVNKDLIVQQLECARMLECKVSK